MTSENSWIVNRKVISIACVLRYNLIIVLNHNIMNKIGSYESDHNCDQTKGEHIN
jgi:hypothetical protein